MANSIADHRLGMSRVASNQLASLGMLQNIRDNDNASCLRLQILRYRRDHSQADKYADGVLRTKYVRSNRSITQKGIVELPI